MERRDRASENVSLVERATVTNPASARPCRLRCPPAEWLLAIAYGTFGAWVYSHTPIKWVSAEVLLYRNLAMAFVTGSFVMIALTFGEALLRGVPAPERRALTRYAIISAAAIALGLFLLIPAPESGLINRLLESATLGAILTALTLTLFLPVAGLVTLRQVGGAMMDGFRLWTPYLVYFVFSSYCLAATRVASPLVQDPVLLRMDLSLGFNPSQLVHAWHHQFPWIRPVSLAAYGLLGLLVALVIARLQIARAWAHARRALLASFLVGVLGLGCYHLVPAVGPIYAFPALYRVLDSPERQAEATAAAEAVLTGPDQIAGPPRLFRNAMPSLHATFTFVSLAAAWHWRRRFFWWCLPLGFLQIATTLTLGYHYLVDLLAAVPLAVFCWWLADRAIRLTPQPADEPLPPTVPSRWLPFSLLVSVSALLAWAALAPLPPWIAWPLAAVVIVTPCYPALAGFSATRPSREGSLTFPAPTAAAPTPPTSPDLPPA